MVVGVLRNLPLGPLFAAVARIQELVVVEVVVLVLVKVAFRHLERLAYCSNGNSDEGTKRMQKTRQRVVIGGQTKFAGSSLERSKRPLRSLLSETALRYTQTLARDAAFMLPSRR